MVVILNKITCAHGGYVKVNFQSIKKIHSHLLYNNNLIISFSNINLCANIYIVLHTKFPKLVNLYYNLLLPNFLSLNRFKKSLFHNIMREKSANTSEQLRKTTTKYFFCIKKLFLLV